MKKFNGFVNRYFGIILLIASLSGLFIPDLSIDSNLVIIIALAFIIFVSFFKVEMDKTLFSGDMKTLTSFFILRFIALPIAVYYILNLIDPFYAVVMFLLLILPAAVSSPAFANMFNGNIGLALKVMVITSFISIATLPLLCKYVLSKSADIDITKMFFTMIYTIIVPFVMHLPFKKKEKIKSFFTLNSPILTVIGLSAIYILATLKNKEIILEKPFMILYYTGLSVVVFLILYIIGFYVVKGKSNQDRISYSICSGANNVGLGVTITALFFPENVNIFFITAQLAWIAALIPIRFFFYRFN